MEKFIKSLRRNYSISLALLILNGLLISQSYSQTFCLTPPTSDYSGFNQSILNMNEDGPFHLRIYVHVIRQSDGTGGQSVSAVYEALSYLDQDYNSHNIFFVWDCVIDYIDNDDYYNTTGTNAIFNVNNHSDGIDIYLFRDQPPPNANGNGLAQGIGATAFYVFGNFWEPPYGSLITSHVTSHEMGHCLNLWHPWQGPNGCTEFVNGTNCEECGDLVCDTPASPGIGFNIDPETCTWTGSGNDPNGDPYDPDEHLVMAYTFPDCMEYHSLGQGQRMRNSIAELSILQNCLVPNANHIITGTVSWNTPVEVIGNIEVEDGGELTITDVVSFLPTSKFIIKPGGKVTIDGGTLTNIDDICHGNSMWQGVEVWGNSSEHQYTIDGQNAQGQLILINNAVIENAISAVELWKPDHYGMTGGIIQARDAVFRNNAKSVHAVYYNNFHPYYPDVEMDNVSYFNNCTFEINTNYLATHTFYKHVDLSHVKGIKFKASDFTLVDVPGVSQWNHGIAAYSAGFSVYAVCTSPTSPCTEYDKCTFTGFRNGIYATATSSTNTFSVNRAVFEDNIYGVKVEGVNNFSVLFSEFYMGNNDDDAEECDSNDLNAAAYGISSSNSTGFAIEENYFTKANGAPSAIYVGIRIDNTLSTDEIYLNSFEGVSYANYAERKNWFGPLPYQGLAYFCNENTGNFADFYVESDINIPSGIQSKQGDDELVTGNKFSPSGATWHFYNGGDHLVGYYYCDYCGNENPDDDKIYNVTDKAKNFDNSCLSHYGGTGEDLKNLVLSPGQEQETELLYATNLTSYNNVKALYDNLKDGGNTEALKTDVGNSWPHDMWELRAELLGKSPHLSMEVLKKAADKTDVLPESVLFEILSANPDELKKEELLKYLEDKENPLPSYMVDILRQVATGVTYKTVLEQQMARYNQAKTRAAYDMIRSNLNDTMSNFNELRNWLDNVGGIRADQQIVASYLQEGNTTDALALANMLPQLYNYDTEALTEHDYYMDMLNLNILLKQEGRTILDLETAEIDNLMIIAENSGGRAGSGAKGILESNYGHHFCDCLNIEGTVGLKSSGAINTGAFTEMFGADVEVQPNPASDWTAFNFNLPGKETKGIIKISDVSGKLIESFVVSGNQGQKIWDTRKIDSGVYFYMFTVNGISKSGKIVISK